MSLKDPNHEATVLMFNEVQMVDIEKAFVFFVFYFRYANLKDYNAISNDVFIKVTRIIQC